MKKTRNESLAWSPDSQQGYTRNRIERACTENRPVLRKFAEWLSDVQDLAPGSITVRLGSACSFVDGLTTCSGMDCARTFQALTPEGVESFFVRYGKHHGLGSRRNMSSGMRLFLTFAFSQGWVSRELSDAVPSLPSYRLSGLPRGPSEEELSILLRPPWEGRCQRRDRAIVYLLATYGVRRGQVSALQLEDIDWKAKAIVFTAHKRGKAIHHVLTPAVAESLADYLQNERPTRQCGDVFLRQTPPHLRLSPGAISALVKSRMKRCGLPPWSPHALRHAFATRLLRADQSVKAIADLLGHRSLATVAVYAKVDHTRLREVALDWPEVAA